MATRLYFQSAATSPDVTPSTWNFAAQSANAFSRKGYTTKQSSASGTTAAMATGTTNPTHRGAMRYVYGPLSAQTISGSIKGQVRCQESNAGANATLGVAVKIIKPDGTDRGVLLNYTAADTFADGSAPEMATSLTNRRFRDAGELVSISLSGQDATAGDYLVVEIGFRSATNVSRNIYFSNGDDSATDLGEDDTDTNPYNPWIEFSATLKWQQISTNTATAGALAGGAATVVTQQLQTMTVTGSDGAFGGGDGIVAVACDVVAGAGALAGADAAYARIISYESFADVTSPAHPARRVAVNENVRTYGTGQAYTSLGTWEADTDNDLVSAATSEILEVYGDSYDESGALIAGGTYSESYFREIRPASGNKLTTGSITKKHFYVTTMNIFRIANRYFQMCDIVAGFNISDASDYSAFFRAGVSTGAQLVRCVAIDCVNGGTGTANGFTPYGNDITLINCLAHNCKTVGIASYGNVYNCVSCNNAIGFQGSADTALKAYNCGAFGNSTAGFQNCSQTACSSTEPTFVDSANHDFHLAPSDTTWKGKGVPLGTIFDDDIDGQRRHAFDIGWDEISLGGVGAFGGGLADLIVMQVLSFDATGGAISGGEAASETAVGSQTGTYDGTGGSICGGIVDIVCICDFQPLALPWASISSRKRGYNEHISEYGTGRTYTVLATWEADTDNNLVALAQSEVLEVYGDSYNDYVSMYGAIASPSYFRIIRPAPGNFLNRGAISTKHFDYSGTVGCLYASESYASIQDIVAKVAGNAAGDYAAFSAYGNGTAVLDCVAIDCSNTGLGACHGFQLITDVSSGSKLYAINCVAHNCDGSGFYLNPNSGLQAVYAYNCVATDSTYGFKAWANFGTNYCYGCGAVNNSSGNFSLVTETNCSSSAPTFAAGTDNFHLDPTDTAWKNADTNTGDWHATCGYNDDIDGHARSGSWDIGIDEVVTLGPAQAGAWGGGEGGIVRISLQISSVVATGGGISGGIADVVCICDFQPLSLPMASLSSRKRGHNEHVSTYGSGKSYTSFEAWEMDTDLNLVSLAQSEVLEIYGNGYNDSLIMAGAVTNESYFRIVRPATGNFLHSGAITAKHVQSTIDSSACIYIQESYAEIQDLVVSVVVTNSSNRRVFIGMDQRCCFVGCVAIDSNNLGSGRLDGFAALFPAAPITMKNCVAHAVKSNGFYLDGGTGDDVRAYNCIADGCNTGFWGSAPTVNAAYGCGASNNTSAFVTLTTTDCSSSAPTFAGVDNFHLDPSDTVWKNADTNTGDWHAACGYNDDIDGHARGATWDIGADEYVTLGPAQAGACGGGEGGIVRISLQISSVVATGGAQAGGLAVATAESSLSVAASGGGISGGIADVLAASVCAAEGGAEAGGLAAVETSASQQSQEVVASGGAEAGGLSDIVCLSDFQAAAGALAGGEAPVVCVIVHVPYAPALVSRRVGVNEHVSEYGTGRTYTALATWEADTDNNLVSLGVSEVLEVYGSGYDDYVIFGDSTTSSLYFRTIRPEPSNRHNGTANVTHFSQLTGSNAAFSLVEEYSRVCDLVIQFTKADSVTQVCVKSYSPNTFAVGCIVKIVNSAGGANGFTVAAGGTLRTINCLAYGNSGAANQGIGFRCEGGTLEAFNCTAYGNYIGFLRSSGTVNNYGCGSTGNITAQFSGTMTNTNCSTSSATFRDAANHDFHLASRDTLWRNADINTGDWHATQGYADDVDGQRRGTTWDIGFDEDVEGGNVGGGTVSVTQLKSYSAVGGATAGSGATYAVVQAALCESGALAGGSASISCDVVIEAVDGCLAGGVADVVVQGLQLQEVTSSGGAISGGDAGISLSFSVPALGGALGGGAAILSVEALWGADAGGVAASAATFSVLANFAGIAGAWGGGEGGIVRINLQVADITATGGAVGGGVADVISGGTYAYQAEGGAFGGGQAPYALENSYVCEAGGLAGGSASVAYAHICEVSIGGGVVGARLFKVDDYFNRATLGTNWTTCSGCEDMTIYDSKEFVGTVDQVANAAFYNASFGDDQYSQAFCRLGGEIGVIVRAKAGVGFYLATVKVSQEG